MTSRCSARSAGVSDGASTLLAATRIAVSGVRRSWLIEASSADFSWSLCRANSAFLAFGEQLRSLNRDRGQAGQRVQRSGLDGAAGDGEQPDRPRADAQRDEPHVAAVDLGDAMPGIGPGSGVEVDRGLGRGERLVELRGVEASDGVPASNTSHAASRGSAMATNSRSKRRPIARARPSMHRGCR